ncbi:MAG: FHA domain-containing protein [Clostridiales bacterium]|nr:FHA domain-containing protein [Clostridiales bacterium]
MLFITRKIEEIITLSKEINITLDDICFDYGGIFIDPSFTKISFLQLPYSGQNKQNGILDLYKLLSLNMDWENNKSIDLTVTEILQIISEWENAEDEKIVNEYQLERIKTILITYEKDKDRFANLFKFGQDLLSGRSKSNNKLILFGNNLLNGIDTEIKGRLLKIGRDNNWADIGINNLIIGRKHAEVYIDNGKYFIKDLNSVNGTYINKMRINSLEKIKIGINDVIGFGDPGGYSVILKDEKSTLKEKFKKFGKMYKC